MGTSAGADRVVVLAGGVGGSKLVAGLARVVAPDDLSIVVNTADDFTHMGLHVSPDLDTVMHRLAGVHDPVVGWGRVDESWTVMEQVAALGGPDWFRLGDRDLATHLVRTARLSEGASLSEVTAELGEALGLDHRIQPMSDDPVRTVLHTDRGTLDFQTWFVRHRCEPEVVHIEFRGAEAAVAAPGVVAAVEAADLVVVAPSNPFLSIDPILAVPELGTVLRSSDRRIVAVSPIVAGRALKGPAAKLLRELGREQSSVGFARHARAAFAGSSLSLVVDRRDRELVPALDDVVDDVVVTDTIMQGPGDETALARLVLGHARSTWPAGSEVVPPSHGRPGPPT